MEDFERLGVFYLGREYDLATQQLKDSLLLYDARDLVTHAVCVGMTGSGKTGLCIGLIEEAAIDGIPSILIDPKGDLTNLLLTFPSLQGADFLPWVNADDAARKGLTPQAYADQQAATWQNGLASWGQDGARIQRLRDAAEFVIYTPGSSAGVGVSILKSFAAPPPEIIEDGELFQERIATTVTSLLGLVGIEADPLQSREHILLSNIIGRMWQAGQDLDLAVLIGQIQDPPFTKVGVLDLQAFYPAKERFALVVALNNLLASPGFAAWLEGQPLDIGQILMPEVRRDVPGTLAQAMHVVPMREGNVLAAVAAILAADGLQVRLLQGRRQFVNMLQQIVETLGVDHNPGIQSPLLDENAPRSVVAVFGRVIRDPAAVADTGDAEREPVLWMAAGHICGDLAPHFQDLGSECADNLFLFGRQMG